MAELEVRRSGRGRHRRAAGGWAVRTRCCWPRAGAKVVVNDTGGSLTGDGADAGPAEEVVREITAAGGASRRLHRVGGDPGGRQGDHRDRAGPLRRHRHPRPQRRQRPSRLRLKEMTYEDFEAVVDVHLRGAFHVVRPAFPLMCEAGYGRIVLTSSIGGLYGNHERGELRGGQGGRDRAVQRRRDRGRRARA